MNDILAQVTAYLATACISIATTALVIFIRNGIKKAEDKVTTLLPQEEALKVNDFLDAVDKLAEMAVLDANSRVVAGLKQQGLFTKETAESIKQAAVQDVLNNLGPLKEKAIGLIGPIENIVAQAIEKHVVLAKQK